MSEYIVETFGIVQDFADLHGDMNTPLYQAIMDVMVSRQHEEIVRCMDCKYNAKDTNGICYRFDHEHFNQPNDFCSWGKRRVVRGA